MVGASFWGLRSHAAQSYEDPENKCEDLSCVPHNPVTNWLMRPEGKTTGVYSIDLPSSAEIKSVEQFLRDAPASLDIDDGGIFYTQFLTLIKELKRVKSQILSKQEVDHLLALGTQFFGNLQIYGGPWLIDQAKKTPLNLPPMPAYSSAQSPDSIKVAYKASFKDQFSIFQRTCNNWLVILGRHHIVDLHHEHLVLPPTNIKIANHTQAKTAKLGFIRDKNGFLPFYAGPYKGLQMVDINYGEPIVIDGDIYPRVVLIHNDQIVCDKGIVLSSYDHALLPVAAKLYGGDGFCTWKNWTYLNDVTQGASPFVKYLHNVFDFNDIITNKNDQFLALPTTSKDKAFVTTMVLEDLIKEKNSPNVSPQILGLIKALEDEANQPLEAIKQNLEREILEAIEEEVQKEEALASEALPDEEKASIIYGSTTTTTADTNTVSSQKPPKKHKGKKHKKPAVSQKVVQVQEKPKRLTLEEINAKAQGIFAKYKVDGRKQFKEITGLLNNLLKDKESFKGLGVDLDAAINAMRVTKSGSHFTYHIEGAETTTTLVNKHRRVRDNKYHSGEVNRFTESLIAQIISGAFSQN